jgi:uncharacterized Ntn-hydrolase superfamily protein
MTFSIVGRSFDPPMFGVAIASSSPAVAARCAHVRTSVGAVATQNITDPALGPEILGLLGAGAPASAALGEALRATPYADYRQVLVLGPTGAPVVHSGVHALGQAASACGAHCAAAGNLLARGDIPAAMVAAFESASGHLGERLQGALRAASALGGEAGPVHSAGLLIVREVSWPIVDLRIDWIDADPIGALGALWRIYAPQIDDYVRRAVDPRGAPAFGVPGNR